MIRPILVALSCALFLVISAPSPAADVGVHVRFSDIEISAIKAYFRDQGMPANNGSKGKHNKSLPPGIARNLQRGKPLPPGIAKQVLPARLIQVLPPAPKGYDRVIVAGKILLVEVATQIVHDILEDAILD